MAKKLDGVIEAVRYAPDGKIALVRAYERRGATYSDHLLISRDELVKRLKAGKRFVVGSRKEFLASTFEVAAEVAYDAARDVVRSGDGNTDQEKLAAPLF